MCAFSMGIMGEEAEGTRFCAIFFIHPLRWQHVATTCQLKQVFIHISGFFPVVLQIRTALEKPWITELVPVFGFHNCFLCFEPRDCWSRLGMTAGSAELLCQVQHFLTMTIACIYQ
jgi:hypothetical protein